MSLIRCRFLSKIRVENYWEKTILSPNLDSNVTNLESGRASSVKIK